MRWLLHGCPVCAGDLHEDLDDRDRMSCFLCARSFAAAELGAARPLFSNSAVIVLKDAVIPLSQVAS
jgi:hypothetical protein